MFQMNENEENIIFLPNDIDEETIQLPVRELIEISLKNKNDINIFIMSNGGNVNAGFEFINVMRLIKNKCRTICIGETCSMGAYILAAGEKGHRFCLPLSRIMIHQISAGVDGDIPQMTNQLRQAQIYNEMLLRDFAKNTNQKLSFVKNLTKEDKWFSAEEARSIGIVDKVIRNYNEIK